MKSTARPSAQPSKLVFACSGAADVGEIADLAARKVGKAGLARMFCTVGIGGKVEPVLEITRKYQTILALDGCPLDCTKRALEDAGFEEFLHLRITDLGMTKGETEVSSAVVSKVAEQVAALLH